MQWNKTRKRKEGRGKEEINKQARWWRNIIRCQGLSSNTFTNRRYIGRGGNILGRQAIPITTILIIIPIIITILTILTILIILIILMIIITIKKR